MKRFTFLFSLVLFAQITFAQVGKIVFKPTWKVGEKKTLTIIEEKITYDGDSIKSKESDEISGEISVTKMDNTHYYLSITYTNVVLKAFQKVYDNLGAELPAYKNIVLQYKVNKQTGKSDLINWKEANAYIQKTFDEVSKVINTKMPEAADMLEIIFTPIKDLFKSKESAEGYFGQEMGCVLAPFGKNYSTKDTLLTREAAKNPFGNDSLVANKRSILNNYNPSAGTCDIVTVTDMDMSQVIQMIKTMMTNMMKKMDPKGEKSQEKMAELDNIKMEMNNVETISFNITTSWFTSCTQKTLVLASMPGKNSKQQVIKTITLK